MIYVQLSSKVLVYERKIYNILDMLGELGGFLKMITLLANLLIFVFGLGSLQVHMVVKSFLKRDR